jgi:hypothetical protein
LHEPDDDKAFKPPSDASSDAAAQGNLLRLHFPKVSHAPPSREPVWIERRGFEFIHRTATYTDTKRESANLGLLIAFLQAELDRGVKHTARTLDDCAPESGMSRTQLRATLHLAVELGHVLDANLPPEECQGRRRTYLVPAQSPRNGSI